MIVPILHNMKVVEWIVPQLCIGEFHIVDLLQFWIRLGNLSHCFTWRPLECMSSDCAVHIQFLSDLTHHIQFRKIKIYFVSCKLCFHKNGNLVLHGACLLFPSNSATVKHNSYVMHTFTSLLCLCFYIFFCELECCIIPCVKCVRLY